MWSTYIRIRRNYVSKSISRSCYSVTQAVIVPRKLLYRAKSITRYTWSIAKPRDLRPSHERFRCMFPARAIIYLHLCGNKDHGRSVKWSIKITDRNREAHKAKCRSDRSIMLRAIDLDPIRFDLFSHFIVLHACLPVENGLQKFQGSSDLWERNRGYHKTYLWIITNRKLCLPY